MDTGPTGPGTVGAEPVDAEPVGAEPVGAEPVGVEPVDQGPRTLVVGEALVDIVRSHDGHTAEHVGGSPANVALTLARLGNPVSLLTTFGPDERGARIAEHLSDNGIDLMLAGPSSERTSTAVAQLGADGQATYEFDLHWALPESVVNDLASPGGARGFGCIHTGSIAAVLSPGGTHVRSVISAARAAATISYDPNARPAIMGEVAHVLPTIEDFVRAADVVKLSDEDANWLSDGDPEALLTRWADLGPSVLVMTRGGEGAVGICGAGRVEVASAPVEVADTVGAGDSFSGALIDALGRAGLLGADRRDALRAIGTDDLEQVMRFAASVAGVTVSRPGADPPRRHELP